MDRERARIARDIHDDVGSSITQVGMLGSMALEDLERVRLLFDDLEPRRDVIDLLGRAERADGVRIFIGSENKLFSLSGSSLIVAPYKDAEEKIVGVLGQFLDGSQTFWQGDVNTFAPHAAAYGIDRDWLWLPVLVAVVVVLGWSFVARRTRFGRELRAMGASESAAAAAMSVRKVMPGKQSRSTAANARARASAIDGPRPVTASTRPPAVTTASPSARVPAWNTVTPSTAPASSRPSIASPVRGAVG